MKSATLSIPYTGDCRNGQAHGKGKYTVTFTANGENTREFAGEFADGKLNGRVSIKTTTPKGITRVDAFYTNNEPNGPYRIVLPDGRVGSLEYRNGKIWSGINQGFGTTSRLPPAGPMGARLLRCASATAATSSTAPPWSGRNC